MAVLLSVVGWGQLAELVTLPWPPVLVTPGAVLLKIVKMFTVSHLTVKGYNKPLTLRCRYVKSFTKLLTLEMSLVKGSHKVFTEISHRL